MDPNDSLAGFAYGQKLLTLIMFSLLFDRELEWDFLTSLSFWKLGTKADPEYPIS
jgi:hypothetical protein